MSQDTPTVESLVARVENRNQRFKIASVVFGAVLTAGLALLLVISLNTLQRVNTQLSSQKRLLNSQATILAKISGASVQRTTQINDLQQHIDCITELFQQPNRASVTITDLEGCKLSTFSPSASSTPPQTSNSGATATQPTTSGGVSSTIPTAPVATAPTTTTPATASNSSTLDRVPVVGRVFKALGL